MCIRDRFSAAHGTDATSKITNVKDGDLTAGSTDAVNGSPVSYTHLNRVLERLNAGKTVRSFLITAVELLTEAVNLLVLQVFRKEDYAVKYACLLYTSRCV